MRTLLKINHVFKLERELKNKVRILRASKGQNGQEAENLKLFLNFKRQKIYKVNSYSKFLDKNVCMRKKHISLSMFFKMVNILIV